jgi:hypothetical protein
VDWEFIVSTICICVRQVNWCMIDNWNIIGIKFGGLRIETSKLMYDR